MFLFISPNGFGAWEKQGGRPRLHGKSLTGTRKKLQIHFYHSKVGVGALFICCSWESTTKHLSHRAVQDTVGEVWPSFNPPTSMAYPILTCQSLASLPLSHVHLSNDRQAEGWGGGDSQRLILVEDWALKIFSSSTRNR